MGLETIALVAGAALSAAGTGVQMSASAAEKANMEQKTRAELARQAAFDQKARGVFQGSLAQGDVATTNKQIAEGIAAKANEYTKLAAIPLGYSEASPVSETSQQQDAGAALAGQESTVRAAVGGYNESDLQNWVKNIRASQSLSMIGQQAKGSAALLPWEIQRASQSRAGQHAAGAGLSALGAVIGAYGAVAPALSAGASAGSAGASAADVARLGGEDAVAASAGYGPAIAAQPSAASLYGWQYLPPATVPGGSIYGYHTRQ